MTTQTERERFEANYGEAHSYAALVEDDNRNYIQPEVQQAWLTWQAAIASMPRVTEGELGELMQKSMRANCGGHSARGLSGHLLWHCRQSLDLTLLARKILTALPHIERK